MKIGIEYFAGERPQFNVTLASREGAEPFITIKGCRVVDGQKGRFVSWPAKKLDSGKYWNHVYASEPFVAAVLAELDKVAKPAKPAKAQKIEDMADDIPF